MAFSTAAFTATRGRYSINTRPMVSEDNISFPLLSLLYLSATLFEGNVFCLDWEPLKRSGCIYMSTAMSPGPGAACGMTAVSLCSDRQWRFVY